MFYIEGAPLYCLSGKEAIWMRRIRPTEWWRPSIGLSWEKVGGVFFVRNYAGGWPEFHFMVHALPKELVV